MRISIACLGCGDISVGRTDNVIVTWTRHTSKCPAYKKLMDERMRKTRRELMNR